MFGFGKDSVNAVSGLVKNTGDALDGLFTSDEERLAFEAKFKELEQRAQERTHELNVLNAQSSSLFVSGWRPMCGWILAGGVALTFVAETFGLQGVQNTDLLWQLAAVMFGSRTFEKFKGVAKS